MIWHSNKVYMNWIENDLHFNERYCGWEETSKHQLVILNENIVFLGFYRDTGQTLKPSFITINYFSGTLMYKLCTVLIPFSLHHSHCVRSLIFHMKLLWWVEYHNLIVSPDICMEKGGLVRWPRLSWQEIIDCWMTLIFYHFGDVIICKKIAQKFH